MNLKEVTEYIYLNVYKYDLEIVSNKDIPYGYQLLIGDINADDIMPLNVYFSEKKGISLLIGGSQKETSLRKRLQNLVSNVKAELYNQGQHLKKKHSWKQWIGTDESGKGDFFGALTAAGFYCDESIQDNLIKIGVTDSKNLKTDKIKEITHKLYRLYNNRIETVVLPPEKYNQLYQDFTKQGKKLNQLLAWMHSRIILNLSLKFPVEGALVDKFADIRVLKSSLKEMKNIHIVMETKAESDLAVATASIIARYHFLQNIESLSKKFSITFPRGSNSKVIECGKTFLEKYPSDRLSEVCKYISKLMNKL